MEPVFSLLAGLFFAAAVYLILSRHIVRIMLGVVLLGNAVNLLLFTGGRVTRDIPPIVPAGLDALPAGAANALPQALILTAIVISFSLFSFLMVLTWRTHRDLATDDSERMCFAEPEDPPPAGY